MTEINKKDRMNGIEIKRHAAVIEVPKSGETPSEDDIITLEELTAEKWGFDDVSYPQALKEAYIKLETFLGKYYLSNINQEHGLMRHTSSPASLPGSLEQKIYEKFLSNYGKIIMSEKMSKDYNCSTMCTDGRKIYIYPYFAMYLTLNEFMFCLCHELNHILLNHCGNSRGLISPSADGRITSYMNELLNIAEDLIINDMLVKDNIGDIPVYKEEDKKNKVLGCYIEGFSRYSAEEALIIIGNMVIESCVNMMSLLDSSCTLYYKESLSKQQLWQNTEELMKYMESFILGVLKNGGSIQIDKNVADKIKDMKFTVSSMAGKNSSISADKCKDTVSNLVDKMFNINPPESKGKGGKGNSSGINITDQDIENMSEKELEELAKNIVEEMLKNAMESVAGGKTIDDHNAGEQMIDDITEGTDKDDYLEEISNNSNILVTKIVEEMEKKGFNLKKMPPGHIGNMIIKRWKALNLPKNREYDNAIFDLFVTIQGIKNETYERYNKKTSTMNSMLRNMGGGGRRVILPSYNEKTGKIVIAIDTSGSLYYDFESMKYAAGEVMRVANKLQENSDTCEFEILLCDTELYTLGLYEANSSEMTMLMDEIKENGLETVGGGGTNLLPIWEYIKDSEKRNEEMPQGLILISDTQTMNKDEIAEMYKNNEFKLPTVVIVPSESCIVDSWNELAKENGRFNISIMEQLMKKDKAEEMEK